jgi:hypothetical protein
MIASPGVFFNILSATSAVVSDPETMPAYSSTKNIRSASPSKAIP